MSANPRSAAASLWRVLVQVRGAGDKPAGEQKIQLQDTSLSTSQVKVTGEGHRCKVQGTGAGRCSTYFWLNCLLPLALVSALFSSYSCFSCSSGSAFPPSPNQSAPQLLHPPRIGFHWFLNCIKHVHHFTSVDCFSFSLLLLLGGNQLIGFFPIDFLLAGLHELVLPSPRQNS